MQNTISLCVKLWDRWDIIFDYEIDDTSLYILHALDDKVEGESEEEDRKVFLLLCMKNKRKYNIYKSCVNWTESDR